MIRIEGLHYSVGNFALRDVSLDVRAGEYFVLLGPSGSGKTVLLECLCGLNRVDAGRILIGDVDVTHREPRNRGIGYLPQDYALFPDRSVSRNILYGLRNQGRVSGRNCVPDEVLALLDLVGARHLADRLPGKLSGGEKQRIALARALAVRPKLLLLDEPVSALDEQMRDKLCPELKQLQRDTQTTTIHVCHNFAEMMAVADRVGVIREGRICQVGTPDEVLERPRTREVAEFVQARNLFAARVESDGVRTRMFGPAGHVFQTATCDSRPPGGQVTLMIRPENIRLESKAPDDAPAGSTLLQGTVRALTDSGALVQFTIDCGSNFALLASISKREYNQRRLLCGDRVHLAVAPGDVHVLEE